MRWKTMHQDWRIRLLYVIELLATVLTYHQIVTEELPDIEGEDTYPLVCGLGELTKKAFAGISYCYSLWNPIA
jgi:hypothetical protein